VTSVSVRNAGHSGTGRANLRRWPCGALNPINRSAIALRGLREDCLAGGTLPDVLGTVAGASHQHQWSHGTASGEFTPEVQGKGRGEPAKGRCAPKDRYCELGKYAFAQLDALAAEPRPISLQAHCLAADKLQTAGEEDSSLFNRAVKGREDAPESVAGATGTLGQVVGSYNTRGVVPPSLNLAPPIVVTYDCGSDTQKTVPSSS
jgi:hypothetical protein